jgi:septum formation protein
VSSKVREDFDEYMLPHEVVMTLALRKAKAVAKKILEDDALIIAADTVVVFEGEVIGKPGSVKAGQDMIKRLSGERHEVLTGVAIMRKGDDKTVVDYESTIVEFRDLTEKEIAEYGKKNECRDKAGGYAIQGIAGKFVTRIEGEYSNVVGLPLGRLTEILNEEFGE